MTMATKIMATNPGTTMDAVVYPATIDNYTTSVATGTAAFAQMFGDFMQKCPQAKVALMGYSQVCKASIGVETKLIRSL